MSIDHRTVILKADVSRVSPSSERIEELWVVCSFYSRVVALKKTKQKKNLPLNP